MGGNERASLAINAMDALGIPEKRVKPVLKRLLRLYDKNWELIEDENYRVLADAIFDQENDDEEATKNKEIQLDDDSSEPPLKRLRLRSQTDLASGSGETVLKRPKIEKEADLPIARRLRSAVHECISDEDEQETPVSSLALTKVNNEEASQLCLRNRAVRDPVSPQSRFREKGKEPMSSSQICHREETTQNHSHLNDSMDECGNVSSPTQHRLKGMEPSSPRRTSREKGALLPRTTYGSYFKEPKVEPGIILLPREKVPDPRQNNGLIKPKSEPTDDLPAVEVPIAIMAPTNLERSSTEDPIHKDGCSTVSGSTERVNCVDADELLPAKERHDVPGKACGIVTSSELVSVLEAPASFEIASSPLGEVKISINCHQAFERRDFRVPSLDAVLKAVEDKCLRSYRILEPNFSLMKLMEEMCQSFLDLSNKPSDPKEDSFLHLTSDFDFLKKSNLRNAFTKSGQNDNIPLSANLSGGSVIESSAGVISAETSKTLLINGLDSHHSLETRGERDMEGSDSSFSNLRSLVVVPQQETTVDVVRPVHDVNDITKGEERVRISLINELSSEPYPPSFYYIPRNIVYQNAYVNFSLARIGDEDCCSNCFGDCLSSSIPCACARETAGEFAYTLEGLVKEKFLNECISMNRDPLKHNRYYCKDCPLERSKEGFSEPCKGHLFRKFIKECWSKCGCSMQCGNRVVQRGITCNLQVFLTSEGKGWGLRTLEELPKGTFICEYVGEILTNMELYDRNMRSTGNEKHTYPVLLDADWGSEGVLKDEEALCLDATYYGNVARFINHKCVDANLVEIPVEVETPDHHYYHLAFFTTRKVDALEELTWDYGIDFDDHNHPVKAFRCRCGSKCCRDMKRSRKIKSRR